MSITPQQLVSLAVQPAIDLLYRSDPFLASEAGRVHRHLLFGPLRERLGLFFVEHGAEALHAEAERVRRFYDEAEAGGYDPYDAPPGTWPTFVRLLVGLQRDIDD